MITQVREACSEALRQAAGSKADRNRGGGAPYQTRRTVGGAIGVRILQAKAARNGSMFITTPLTRYLPVEWGSVFAASLAWASVRLTHQDCAYLKKKRCAAV